MDAELRRRNLKTALVLASIALTTCAGIVAKYWLLGG
ncbi:MAG: cytochrome oxidase small assembly protein [Burkholderiales bacterium]|nr:cytochrome oxidase small assembly protein [Burkholderiales bacterium]MDW8469464.1 cytochrome oxidase small assembly protein [Burkholderiales bacterium]